MSAFRLTSLIQVKATRDARLLNGSNDPAMIWRASAAS